MDKRLVRLRNVRFVLEIVVFVGIVCLIVTFSMTAGILPGKQGVQSAGMVGRFGMRPVLFAVFLIGGGLTGLFFLLSRFQRLYKYPVEINAGNVELQYHIAKFALCVYQLITLALACLLMIRIYMQTIEFMSSTFIEMTLTGLFAYGIVFAIYIYVARKYR